MLRKGSDEEEFAYYSKFLVESMLGTKGPRVGFLLDPSSNHGIGCKVQDSLKQHFILCPICEERISMI